VIVQGDATALPLPDSSVHAIVCDPPYELAFMGRSWDRSGVAFRPQTWVEALRVAIPGAHLLAFGGTRTFHRLAVAIEDAGWEIRDSIGLLGWCYGQGFPKSLDIGKAIDKAVGAERQVIGPGAYANRGRRTDNRVWRTSTESVSEVVTAPATADAERWQGWGTALKPAWEPIIVARKPLVGTVAGNVLANGVGGINIDGCRVSADLRPNVVSDRRSGMNTTDGDGLGGSKATGNTAVGRWPTNLLLTHHPDCADECRPDCHVWTMDQQSGVRTTGALSPYSERHVNRSAYGMAREKTYVKPADTGTAPRFFPVFRYNAKASSAERPRLSTPDGRSIMHPTVKPVALLRWLVKLITPPGGVVLDQFAGTGSTLAAAAAEGFAAVGVELDYDHCRLTRHRLAGPSPVDRPKRTPARKPPTPNRAVTVWTVDEAREMHAAGYSVEHIARVTGHALTTDIPSSH
jgi:DNA modification methylase